ncbi:hypothetical protein [Actinacidiphila sp. bgisy145]|uniref:hypothetical protein n=1 Tax=Actinacidiphila sp. bgisy145 TaxID=3413792 RepID=UPI003EBF75D0
MYGPGPVPQRPKPAAPAVAVVLRVILTAVPVITLGFLAWVSMLYLAVLRKRFADWLVLAVAAAMAVLAVVCFGVSQDDDDMASDLGATLILICMFGGAVYFLIADIVRYSAARRSGPGPAGYPPQHPYATGFGGAGPIPAPHAQGYPAHQPYPGPAVGTAVPPPTNRPNTPPPTPVPTHVPTPPPAPAPGPAHPTPPPAPRIDQVRAELDELSDFLRKERDAGQDSGEGGAAR